jgi:hypothetical protein
VALQAVCESNPTIVNGKVEKMIQILDESQGKILGVRLTGKVTDDDYEKIFIPELQKIISAYGNVSCLYYMDVGFEGWKAGALWEDAKFGLRHKKTFDKIAVVGGPDWARWAAKVGGHLVSGELRTFPTEELEKAWAWIKS